MSTNRRKAEKLRAQAAKIYDELRSVAEEERRQASLSMYEKIEEASSISDIKQLLHEIADKLGMT